MRARTAAIPIGFSGSDKHQRRWTPAMIAFLSRHRREGRTLRWIAKALGVSFEEVRRKAVRLGLALSTAYQSRVLAVRLEDEPEAIGGIREILDCGSCHWITGDVIDPDWRMCGHPREKSSAWCAHHHARVFWVVDVSEKRAA